MHLLPSASTDFAELESRSEVHVLTRKSREDVGDKRGDSGCAGSDTKKRHQRPSTIRNSVRFETNDWQNKVNPKHACLRHTDRYSRGSSGRKLLREHSFTQCLGTGTKQCMASAAVYTVYSAGDIIVREGSLTAENDMLFLLNEGSVEVSKCGKALTKLEPGSSFGVTVIAQLSSTHLFTITAVSIAVCVYKLPRSHLLDRVSVCELEQITTLTQNQLTRISMNCNWAEEMANKIPLFRSCESECRIALAQSFFTKAIPRNSNLPDSDGFFLAALRYGEAEVRFAGLNFCTLHAGDVFGEACFIKGDASVRKGMVITAVTDCIFLELKYEYFYEILEEFPTERAHFEQQRVAREHVVNTIIEPCSRMFIELIANSSLTETIDAKSGEGIAVSTNLYIVTEGYLSHGQNSLYTYTTGAKRLPSKQYCQGDYFGAKNMLGNLVDLTEENVVAADFAFAITAVKMVRIPHVVLCMAFHAFPRNGKTVAVNLGCDIPKPPELNTLPILKSCTATGTQLTELGNILQWHVGFPGQSLSVQGKMISNMVLLGSGECTEFLNGKEICKIQAPCSFGTIESLSNPRVLLLTVALSKLSLYAFFTEKMCATVTPTATRVSVDIPPVQKTRNYDERALRENDLAKKRRAMMQPKASRCSKAIDQYMDRLKQVKARMIRRDTKDISLPTISEQDKMNQSEKLYAWRTKLETSKNRAALLRDAKYKRIPTTQGYMDFSGSNVLPGEPVAKSTTVSYARMEVIYSTNDALWRQQHSVTTSRGERKNKPDFTHT
eukprot:GEMP01013475.1.p1 GENE.GEMP01013475.1~~GEMP01013475.1.p1  ORF type:complete len:780 (+),score=91.93 GEMP01013475.1:69-2408(+)